jgi:site-specific recombinase XerD
MAYARAVKQFLDWCEDHHLGLEDIEPIAIAAYIEELGSEIAKPSVKRRAVPRACRTRSGNATASGRQ